MLHIHSLNELQLNNTWLTIGSFDGVHLGHQTIIKNLADGAKAADALSVVLTFEPHPAAVLRPTHAPAKLTTTLEKVRILGELGIDIVVTHPFTHETAKRTAREFILELKKHLGFSHLWVGYDFAMGRNRDGDTTTLREMGQELGYDLHIIDPSSEGGQIISSSRIRQLLREGHVAEAAKLLGRPFGLSGTVIEGAQRGRSIGVPTANLTAVNGHAIPGHGVYVCKAHLNGKTWGAATNIGVRPTFEGDPAPTIEAHLLDFDREIYGDTLRLDFVARLRGSAASRM